MRMSFGGSFGFAYKSVGLPSCIDSVHHLGLCPLGYIVYLPLSASPNRQKESCLCFHSPPHSLPNAPPSRIPMSTCNSFNAALKSCSTTSINITAVGNKMNTDTVHCMCVSSSSGAELGDCSECVEGADEVEVDNVALTGWYNTCIADGVYGDQQAVACWEGMLDNLWEDSLLCMENALGEGSASTSGGPEPVVSSVNR